LAAGSCREPALGGTPCRLTPAVREEPPRDYLADPFGEGPWYINQDRAIWAWRGEAWVAGEEGNKVLWIRPPGTRLQVRGLRLDRAAALIQSRILGVYGSGFQPAGLNFPSAGCWEISARAGSSTLTFVTRVEERRAR
jgi:hypothetical protein